MSQLCLPVYMYLRGWKYLEVGSSSKLSTTLHSSHINDSASLASRCSSKKMVQPFIILVKCIISLRTPALNSRRLRIIGTKSNLRIKLCPNQNTAQNHNPYSTPSLCPLKRLNRPDLIVPSQVPLPSARIWKLWP